MNLFKFFNLLHIFNLSSNLITNFFLLFKLNSKSRNNILILCIFLLFFFSCSFLMEKPSPVVEKPKFNMPGGVYNDLIIVTISCNTDGAKIIYTTNGSAPSKNNGSFYNSPITLNKTTVIKAIAVKDLWEDSAVSEVNYTIIGDIIVKYGTQLIPDSTGEFTVFTNMTGSNIETTFIIENISNSTITLENITFDSTSDYYSIVQPVTFTIPAALNTSFIVNFCPLIYSTTAATIIINSSDIENGPYTFKVIGKALENSTNPEIDVTADTTNIISGSYTYDFSLVNIGEECTSDVFTIRNNGTTNLWLSGNPIIGITGGNADKFAVIQPLNRIIQPGKTEAFRLKFIPLKTSSVSADVIIANNDSDESLFTFKITGQGKDNTPPNLQSNVITASNITSSAVTLNWIKAIDDISPQPKLEYCAYYSDATSDMNSVAKILANGTPFGSFIKNINTIGITGLSPSTDYYINVIVKDEADNKSCYSMIHIRTLD
jgi:hypothetical protein